MENNVCILSGEVASDFRFSHEIYGEKFFQFDLRIERLSGVADIIPVTVSERLIDIENDILGRFVNVNGEFRSYNNKVGEKTHLVLFAFARSIEVVDVCDNTNSVDFMSNCGISFIPICFKTTKISLQIGGGTFVKSINGNSPSKTKLSNEISLINAKTPCNVL